MKYCIKCVMPSTRPGITFDENGVCCACNNYQKRSSVNWQQRKKELETLCDKYRGKVPGGYDCIIAVSGGKDSHYQVYIMKEVMKMNPLLVSVYDNFPITNAGRHNIQNISEQFGCDLIMLSPKLKAQKTIMRKTFEKYGKPTWFIDRLIYTYPLHMAVKFQIPLLVYGENVSYEYGGANQSETPSAKDQINNGVASDIDYKELTGDGVTEKELSLHTPPAQSDIDKLEPIYLSYFLQGNSVKNYEFAKTRGFKDLEGEWHRTHHIENYDQVESPAYLVHSWLKYPKFGHQAATDYASRFIRYGLMDRSKAVELVQKHDHDLDKRSIKEFCEFLGYTKEEFWNIVDKFFNREIFVKEQDVWKLKEPLK